MTLIAVAIMVEELAEAHAKAAIAGERGADLVEYRIDTFHDDHKLVEQLVEASPIPCIVTCRTSEEGGEYDGDDQHRLATLEHAGLKHPAYIDLELITFERSANLRQKIKLVVEHPNQPPPTTTGLILSYHDFKQRPANLLQQIEKMVIEPACRVVKVAWMPKSLRDNLQAFELIEAGHKPTIALCMGEMGLPSRILAKKFGALLTFAGLEDGQVTAPGQPGVSTLKNLYRWDKLNKQTEVYGVIGWPVAHSMSPHIHNRGFDEVNYDGVYLPMPIPPEYEHFKATVGSWLDYETLHFKGASVTLPHKENLIRFVEENDGEVEELAASIGAANTLSIKDGGKLYASNTDYAAALDSVCDAMGKTREEMSGVRVAVIGAGGVSRAVIAGFAGYGATVVVYNRTAEKAEKLAEEFNAKLPGKVVAAPLENLCKSCCEVYVNCTPLGMHPNEDATPLPELPETMNDQTVVFDTIYNPVETRLLKEAKAAGAKTISGVDMFVRQGVAQFELWTGKTAPAEAFREVILEQLGK